MKVRIKQVDYASGLTLYYPQVKWGLFWRYFRRAENISTSFFSPKLFFKETTFFRRKRVGIPIREYVETRLKGYLRSYEYFMADKKIIKIVDITDF